MRKVKRGAAPRVDESRPAKDAGEPPSYRGQGKTDQAPAVQAQGGSAKEAFDRGAVRRPRQTKRAPEYADQQPPTARSGAKAPGEAYVRLRVRVSDGQLTIVDSHLVEGPLGQPTGFSGANAYEVTLDDRLLHAGALPDMGVQRSFANPEGPAEQHQHFVTDRGVYEFSARVPAHEVTPETVGQIAVRLHRVKDAARTDRLSAAPLGRQFGREIRQVAEVVGLPDSALPEAIEARGARTPSV